MCHVVLNAADLPQTYREECLNIFQNHHLDRKHPPKKTASSTTLDLKEIIDHEKHQLIGGVNPSEKY